MRAWSAPRVNDTALRGLSGLTRPGNPGGRGKPHPEGYGPQVVVWPEGGSVRYAELGGRAYYQEVSENENRAAREVLLKHDALRRCAPNERRVA